MNCLIQWTPLIVALSGPALSGHNNRMALISGGILVLMWILGPDFSGHYNRMALISVDIISGIHCNDIFRLTLLLSEFFAM